MDTVDWTVCGFVSVITLAGVIVLISENWREDNVRIPIKMLLFCISSGALAFFAVNWFFWENPGRDSEAVVPFLVAMPLTFSMIFVTIFSFGWLAYEVQLS